MRICTRCLAASLAASAFASSGVKGLLLFAVPFAPAWQLSKEVTRLATSYVRSLTAPDILHARHIVYAAIAIPMAVHLMYER